MKTIRFQGTPVSSYTAEIDCERDDTGQVVSFIAWRDGVKVDSGTPEGLKARWRPKGAKAQGTFEALEFADPVTPEEQPEDPPSEVAEA